MEDFFFEKFGRESDSALLFIQLQVVPGQSGGGSFRRKRTINQRKNLPIECDSIVDL